jgi:glycerate kinase
MKADSFVLIPDSFKGTMSSSEICDIFRKVISKYYPEASVTSIPVADGGEGSVDAFLQAIGGQRIAVSVSGPFSEKVDCCYGLVNGDTAVIEMASCAGLPLADGKLNPLVTSTYGVGEQMLDAARRGCRKIIVGLGGSCTTDGGCPAAAACGVKFLDHEGKSFVPAGGTLSRIARIDASGLDPAFSGVRITAMCDVDNPLYGENGAACVFGPQKGADPEVVRTLDCGLEVLGDRILDGLGVDVRTLPGGGAAGGMGAGMVAFFGAELRMGIETVLDAVDFDEKARNADFVFTGEGKIDSQSLRGKVVIGVARRVRASHSKARVIAFVGDIGDGIEAVYSQGVDAIFSTNRLAIPFRESRIRAKSDLELTADNILRFLSIL